MPNPYVENSQRWLELSEIDYLGHFVKAWLAFNAWYRNSYTHTQDREIINEIKWHTNPVRDRLIPLLTSSTEEAKEFRSFIGALHHKLENKQLYSGKGAEKDRITLKEVYLKPNDVPSQNGNWHGIYYLVELNITRNPKPITCTVTNKIGKQIFNLTQQRYDLAELEICQDFCDNLTLNQQSFLKGLYKSVNPRLVVDLTGRGESPIEAGAYRFTCTPNELFAGVCEVVFMMRNTLFHGELVPNRDATACYEPAYNIVRKFLTCIE